MIIFGVDSSSAAGSAAAVRDGELLYEAFANEGLTHSETLLVRCDEVFREAGLTPKEVGCYAVTAGPGSFTGLRIGLGLVKGLAFVRETPCVPVSTFEALAFPLLERGKDLLCVLDARQKRVYCAGYHVAEGNLIPALAPQILPLSGLDDAIRESGISDPLIAGDAAAQASEAVNGGTDAGEEYHFVHAGAVALVAERLYRQGAGVAPNELRPVYLQASQAERERNKRLQGGTT